VRADSCRRIATYPAPKTRSIHTAKTDTKSGSGGSSVSVKGTSESSGYSAGRERRWGDASQNAWA
jgi:hypothetical protein